MPLLTLVPIIGFVLVVRRCFDMRTSSAAMHAVSILLLTLYLAALAGILLWSTLALLVAGTVLAVYEGLLLARSKTMLPGIGAFVDPALEFVTKFSGTSQLELSTHRDRISYPLAKAGRQFRRWQ